MPKYDVVVVGAGNSGLTAALELITAKKKVLLIEQHNLPGGCATSFIRGRFEFDPSLHELCGVGSAKEPGSVRQMLSAYGVKVDWIPVKDCFRVISRYSDGSPMDVTMPTGVDNFIYAMESYVPGSKTSMKKLFALFEEVCNGVGYLTGASGNPETKVLQEEYGNFLRTGGYNANKVLKAVGLPQKARDILASYWSYLGVPLDRLNFIHFAEMVFSYVKEGPYIPKNTSHEISVALLERFRELGGDIWMNCRAEEFLFDEERICGVRTSNGIVDCDYVLANINPDIVYSRMVPADIVPPAVKKLSAARNHNYSGRMFTCYFGLDCTPERLGITDYSTFFYGTADSAREYYDINRGFLSDDFFIMLCYNIANPSFSPDGTCVISLTTFTAAEDWNNLDSSEYGWQKSKVAAELVRELREKTGIDIAPHIEEMETASPVTFARYVNAPEGCVYGYEIADWDGMMARMMMLSEEQSLKGLRLIGAAGAYGVGYNMTYATGQLEAMLTLADMARNRHDSEADIHENTQDTGL